MIPKIKAKIISTECDDTFFKWEFPSALKTFRTKAAQLWAAKRWFSHNWEGESLPKTPRE